MPAKGKGRNHGRGKGGGEVRVFAEGDLVFAEVKGYPPWPARVESGLEEPNKPGSFKYPVHFFSTCDTAKLTSNHLYPYKKYKEKYGVERPLRSKKLFEHFKAALAEIAELAADIVEISESESFTPEEQSAFDLLAKASPISQSDDSEQEDEEKPESAMKVEEETRDESAMDIDSSEAPQSPSLISSNNSDIQGNQPAFQSIVNDPPKIEEKLEEKEEEDKEKSESAMKQEEETLDECPMDIESPEASQPSSILPSGDSDIQGSKIEEKLKEKEEEDEEKVEKETLYKSAMDIEPSEMPESVHIQGDHPVSQSIDDNQTKIEEKLKEKVEEDEEKLESAIKMEEETPDKVEKETLDKAEEETPDKTEEDTLDKDDNQSKIEEKSKEKEDEQKSESAMKENEENVDESPIGIESLKAPESPSLSSSNNSDIQAKHPVYQSIVNNRSKIEEKLKEKDDEKSAMKDEKMAKKRSEKKASKSREFKKVRLELLAELNSIDANIKGNLSIGRVNIGDSLKAFEKFMAVDLPLDGLKYYGEGLKPLLFTFKKCRKYKDDRVKDLSEKCYSKIMSTLTSLAKKQETDK